jgi:DNA (cytosine-5)-methyltransferase 1
MSQAPTLTKANSRPRAMNELALFAGAGGGILGGALLGWRTVCAVERDPYAAGVLVARQNDGSLAPFPIWDDVCTFDGRPWRGIVDVVSGGFPCQDISTAGKGAGIDGERSGLWVEMARIIGEVRPRFAFVENSPALITRGLGRVLGDLAALGYDCRWTVLSAADVGAHHLRKRLWLVASDANQELGDSRAWPVEQLGQFANESWDDNGEFADRVGRWVEMAGKFSRMDDGLAGEVDRTAAIGNGQVPQCAAAAWRLLTS